MPQPSQLPPRTLSLKDSLLVAAELLKAWRTVAPELGWPLTPPSSYPMLGRALRLFEAMGGDVLQAPGTRRELAEQLLYSMRWAANGFPIFAPTESLSAALVLTDPGAVTAEAFRLPFDSFCIELPWPRSPFAIDDAEGNPVKIRWINVSRVEAGEKDPVGWRISSSTMLVIRLMAETGLSCYETIPAPSTGPLTPWLAKDYGDREEAPDDLPKEALTLARRDRLAVRGARAFVTNLCLYVASLPATGTPPRTSSGRNRKADASIATPTRWVLGREIKLGAELREAARSFAERGERKRPWKLEARFVVRGHWRNQACGPKHSEHRPRWIEPYWKGPVTAPGLVRVFGFA